MVVTDGSRGGRVAIRQDADLPEIGVLITSASASASAERAKIEAPGVDVVACRARHLGHRPAEAAPDPVSPASPREAGPSFVMVVSPVARRSSIARNVRVSWVCLLDWGAMCIMQSESTRAL